ncbi:unnamed protein product [Rhodiola kirilowii]
MFQSDRNLLVKFMKLSAASMEDLELLQLYPYTTWTGLLFFTRCVLCMKLLMWYLLRLYEME